MHFVALPDKQLDEKTHSLVIDYFAFIVSNNIFVWMCF